MSAQLGRFRDHRIDHPRQIAGLEQTHDPSLEAGPTVSPDAGSGLELVVGDGASRLGTVRSRTCAGRPIVYIELWLDCPGVAGARLATRRACVGGDRRLSAPDGLVERDFREPPRACRDT